MAEKESKECPCSNITIMQLFHELKQRYPKIPDHVVSKVIEQNFHDKTACETILQKESHYYLQSYPGALILGSTRDQNEPLCKHCSVSKPPQQHKHQRSPPTSESSSSSSPEWTKKREFGSFRRRDVHYCNSNDESNSFSNKPSRTEENFPLLSVTDFNDRVELTHDPSEKDYLKGIDRDSDCFNSDQKLGSSSSSLRTYLGSFTEEEAQIDTSFESSAVITDETSESGCDSERKKNLFRSQSSIESSSLKGERRTETRRWRFEDRDKKSGLAPDTVSNSSSSSDSPTTHNYQVAVECSMQPILLNSCIHREPPRSFTSVNLCLRLPSSEPQPPIEIHSGQSLTYTTSSFNPKKGYQSQLQIRIDPGGGSTFSACRTYISTPQFSFSSSKSPNCTNQFPRSHRCQSRHHLRELLNKQMERKDLLARELRREKEKLRSMQNEVRRMKAAIAQRPDPHILPKLKDDISRLRKECERLTAAVDDYSDNQREVLPLGETNENFYHNLYTGQRFQREDSWSCQLCTFLNHPLIKCCEACGMPRLSLGTTMTDVTSNLSNVFSNNNTAFCTAQGHPHPRDSSLPHFKNGK